MQQVVQPINGQNTEIAEIPIPACGPQQLLIANSFSLISPGTERATVELAQQSLWQKAKKRPDHVRRVLEKVRQEGIWNTVRQVRAKLGQPMPLGYCSAGTVVEVGSALRDFRVGDRVASNGPHAGVVAVSPSLVARVPENVGLDHAAFAVLGSIALQAVRLANVGIGDVVAVVGLGLIGQLAVSLLRAAGCTVIGTDLDPSKRELALTMGAHAALSSDAFEALVAQRTGGHGADSVLIAASTTSNGPLELAARIARKKSKIVALGAVGMNVPRRDFYPKELELVVSCSYGPGRYDPSYEEKGIDYPYAYVRWTEQRNIQAVLDQMAAGTLNVSPLVSHRFPIDRATEAYELIAAGEVPTVGVLLEYPEAVTPSGHFVGRSSSGHFVGRSPGWHFAGRSVPIPQTPDRKRDSRAASKETAPPRTIGLSVIGAGGFATSTLLPLLAQKGRFALRGLVSANGFQATAQAKKWGFAFAGTDLEAVLADEQTEAVLIATRHDTHTPLGLKTLRAGKHLFLEKPLAICDEQFEEWMDYAADPGANEGPSPLWMVGFNRRFSPAVTPVREHFATIDAPKHVFIRFNAGAIPADHWTQDEAVGGGRIIGEACHAIDLATYLTGSLPARVFAEGVLAPTGRQLEDDVTLVIRHQDGSVSNILYTSAGDRAAGKERIEMHGGGSTAVVDDFRRSEIHHKGRRVFKKSWWSQAKGHRDEMLAFADAITRGEVSPISPAELLAVTSASLRAVTSLRLELPLEVA